MERVQLQLGKGGVPGSRAASGRLSAHSASGRGPRLSRGQVVAGHVVEDWLGSGWEGCVYRVRCSSSGQRRVLKCFRRRPGLARAFRRSCRQLDAHAVGGVAKPSASAMRLVQGRRSWPAVLLDYCPGFNLDHWFAVFQKHPPAARQVVAIGHAVLKRLSDLHARGAYHGDLHTGNIVAQRRGLGYSAYFVDPFPQAGPIRGLQQDDLVDAVRLFDDLLQLAAAPVPGELRALSCGRRRDRIARCYPTVEDFLQDFKRRQRAVLRATANLRE